MGQIVKHVVLVFSFLLRFKIDRQKIWSKYVCFDSFYFSFSHAFACFAYVNARWCCTNDSQFFLTCSLRKVSSENRLILISKGAFKRYCLMDFAMLFWKNSFGQDLFVMCVVNNELPLEFTNVYAKNSLKGIHLCSFPPVCLLLIKIVHTAFFQSNHSFFVILISGFFIFWLKTLLLVSIFLELFK